MVSAVQVSSESSSDWSDASVPSGASLRMVTMIRLVADIVDPFYSRSDDFEYVEEDYTPNGGIGKGYLAVFKVKEKLEPLPSSDLASTCPPHFSTI